jgi:hypothetical protein
MGFPFRPRNGGREPLYTMSCSAPQFTKPIQGVPGVRYALRRPYLAFRAIVARTKPEESSCGMPGRHLTDGDPEAVEPPGGETRQRAMLSRRRGHAHGAPSLGAGGTPRAAQRAGSSPTPAHRSSALEEAAAFSAPPCSSQARAPTPPSATPRTRLIDLHVVPADLGSSRAEREEKPVGTTRHIGWGWGTCG